MKKGIIALDTLNPKDDLEMLHQCIFLYSCYRKMSGRVRNPLAHKPIVLLSLYLQKGISKETKDMAGKFFGVNEKYMNSLNYTLRQGGYIVKDKYKDSVSHLNPTLEKIRKYYLESPKTVANFLIQFEVDYGEK